MKITKRCGWKSSNDKLPSFLVKQTAKIQNQGKRMMKPTLKLILLLAVLSNVSMALAQGDAALLPFASSFKAQSKPQIIPNDLREELEACRILSGPWKGGYKRNRNAAGFHIYFGGHGLMAIASDPAYSQKVEAFLDLYLRTADPVNGWIDDVENINLNPNKLGVRVVSDSDDSYISMFVLLTNEYHKTSAGQIWWTKNREQIKRFTTLILLENQLPNGLVSGYSKKRDFTNATLYPSLNTKNDPKARSTRDFKQELRGQAYLMDNCEVWAALNALAKILQAEGDGDAIKFQLAAQKVAKGIANLFNEKHQAFYFYDAHKQTKSKFYAEEEIKFYPHRVAGVWPQLFQVPLGDTKTTLARYDAGWKFLNAGKTDGYDWATELPEDSSAGGFPWMALGYISSLRGDDELARIQLDRFLVGKAAEEKEEKNNATEKATRGLKVPHYYRYIQELGPASLIQQKLAQKK